MSVLADALSNAAILEITKPSGTLGIAEPLIVGAASGDLAGQREIRDAYLRVVGDKSKPLSLLVASADCAVLTARLAASHGELEDVLSLADALLRASDIWQLCGVDHISQSRLVEGLGLYKRIASTGHALADRTFQMLAAAMPASVMERVMEDEVRIGVAEQGNAQAENVRTH